MQKDELYVDDIRKQQVVGQHLEQLFFQNLPEFDKGKCLTDGQARIKFLRNTRKI